MIYLDSCAIVKLARREAETDALRRWLAQVAEPPVTSALARTETSRALMRTEPAALRVLSSVLSTIHQMSVTNRILDSAATIPGSALRSLDALHVATAQVFGPALSWFVTYDKRLYDAAVANGLPAMSPS